MKFLNDKSLLDNEIKNIKKITVSDSITINNIPVTSAKIDNWDTVYGWGNHAVEGYLKEITKAMVEGVLTGTITSHNHTDALIPYDERISALEDMWVIDGGVFGDVAEITVDGGEF